MTRYTLPDASGSTVSPDLHSFVAMENSSNTSYADSMTSDNTSLEAIVTQEPVGKFGALEKYPEFWAAFYLNNYSLKIIAAFGFPGNILR
ncbi:hypothetical protein ACOMHN_030078 [Nucella lapillus]